MGPSIRPRPEEVSSGTKRLTESDLGELVESVQEAAGALIQADVRRYFAL